MILGIMQPYFFPYLGHFQLIAKCDKWIVFDVVKYKRRSWMNRNRILHPSHSWQYICAPVRAERGGLINEMTILQMGGTCKRILGQLDHYKGKAPYFESVLELVRNAFACTPTDRLLDLNVTSLKAVCGHLGIRFDYSVCSEMGLLLPPIEHAGDWALEICDRVGAKTYVNPASGREIFSECDWKKRGIDLQFYDPTPLEYSTNPYNFVSNLSIIDVLMWNSPSDLRQAILA